MNVTPISNAVNLNPMKNTLKSERYANNTAVSFGKIGTNPNLNKKANLSIKSAVLALGILLSTVFGLNSCQKRHHLPELDTDYLQAVVGTDEFNEELVEWEYSLYKYCLDAQIDVFRDEADFKSYRKSFGDNPNKMQAFANWGAPDGNKNLSSWEKLKKNDYTPETSALFVIKYEKAKDWYNTNFSK